MIYLLTLALRELPLACILALLTAIALVELIMSQSHFLISKSSHSRSSHTYRSTHQGSGANKMLSLCDETVCPVRCEQKADSRAIQFYAFAQRNNSELTKKIININFR